MRLDGLGEWVWEFRGVFDLASSSFITCTVTNFLCSGYP